jgi:hypothetical protein
VTANHHRTQRATSGFARFYTAVNSNAMLSRNICRCIVVIAGIIVAGCAGFKDVSYFSPVPRDDIRVRSTFRGLPEVAKIPLSESVELSLVIFDQPQKSSLRLLFALPAGELARFVDGNVIVSPSDSGPIIVGTIETIQANYIVNGRGSFRYLTSSDNLEGATYEYKSELGGTTSVHRPFEINVAFPVKLPDRFNVRIPPLNLSGKAVSIPNVEVRREIGAAYQGSPP